MEPDAVFRFTHRQSLRRTRLHMRPQKDLWYAFKSSAAWVSNNRDFEQESKHQVYTSAVEADEYNDTVVHVCNSPNANPIAL